METNELTGASIGCGQSGGDTSSGGGKRPTFVELATRGDRSLLESTSSLPSDLLTEAGISKGTRQVSTIPRVLQKIFAHRIEKLNQRKLNEDYNDSSSLAKP